MILDRDGSQIGVMVDDVHLVVTVSADDLEADPTGGAAVDAFAKLGDRLVMLLDPTALTAASV